jgi:hypothetical protein
MKTTRVRIAGTLLGLGVLWVNVPTARADDGPEGSKVFVRKVTVDSGLTRTVKYVVTGGSPRLQAIVRRVEWAENELGIIEQLQLLKMDTVLNERRAAAARATQLTSPYFVPVYPPPYIPEYAGAGSSPLQKSLSRQLAYSATPDAAMQLIGFLEQQQTELDAELKTLPPPEKKAGEEVLAALKPRLDALPHNAATPPAAQPVAPLNALAAPPVDPFRTGATVPPAAPPAVEVEWHGTWYAAEVLGVSGGQTHIHYAGWASSWDEWVPASRIRPAGGSPTSFRR